MIRVQIARRNGGYTLEMEGHAGYNPGNDIVCAGASALVYALLGALQNLKEQVEALTADLESGHARISCNGGGAVEIAFFTVETGLRQLEAGYPGYICVK